MANSFFGRRNKRKNTEADTKLIAQIRQKLSLGGPVNPWTGMGGSSDKGRGIRWEPSRYTYQQLRLIYRESSAARKIIKVPASTCVDKWREFVTPDRDSDARKLIESHEIDLDVKAKFREAIEDARLYGTSVIFIRSKDAAPEEPLLPERIMRGDVVGLTVFPGECVRQGEKDTQVLSVDYGKPLYYDIYGKGSTMRVHPSRILRFTGEEPKTVDGDSPYDSSWGTSSLVSCMLEVNDDATWRSAVTQLITETNILVYKSPGVAQILQAIADTNLVDSEQGGLRELIKQIKQNMSVFDMVLTDSEGTVERLSVNWSGVANIIETMQNRICAATGIPAAIFWGKAPAGLNSSGDSDHRSFGRQIKEWQNTYCTAALRQFDPILSASAGVNEVLPWVWLPYFNPDTAKEAEEENKRVTSVLSALSAGIIDEDEARMMLDGMPTFGTLTGPAPGALATRVSDSNE